MGQTFDVLIVGMGHGGAQAAIALRQRGYQGSIAMVGEEAELPYERPPLSKDYLAGSKAFERLLIRPPAFWRDRQIATITGRRIVGVDPAAHRVVAMDGGTIGYRRLVWAAGGRPRRLACDGHDLAGVHTVRTRADVDRLLAELPAAVEIAIVGGGYIGLEAAAILSATGKRVTVLEAHDRVLARVAGEPLSRFYEAEHRARGVEIRLGASVARLEGRAGRVTGVRLADGAVLPAQLVIVGIGIIPAGEPLLEAGADGGNGVLVDDHGRTSLPDIFAIGDCALHANRYAGGQVIRLESVQNANDLAATVAGVIVGQPVPYDAVPWFWSNQYDLRLQTVGLSLGHDAVVCRGDPSGRRFALVYLKEGRVVALDCVNAVSDFVQGKALVASGARMSPAALADASRPLKTIDHLS